MKCYVMTNMKIENIKFDAKYVAIGYTFILAILTVIFIMKILSSFQLHHLPKVLVISFKTIRYSATCSANESLL